MNRCMLVLMLSLSLPLSAAAERTVSALKPVMVLLSPNHLVVLNYPETIEKVVGWKADDQEAAVSIEFWGTAVYLNPRHEAEGRIFAVGESGFQYAINFKPGSPGDDIITLIRPSVTTEAKGQPFTVAALLRTLVLLTERPGMALLPGMAPVEMPLPGLPDARLQVVHTQAFGLGPGLGLILRVQNMLATSLQLDLRVGESEASRDDVVALQQWVWPPHLTLRMVALGSGAAPLRAGEQTMIYCVFERR